MSKYFKNKKRFSFYIIALFLFFISFSVFEAVTQSENEDFPQPLEISSVDGVLNTTFDMHIATNTMEDAGTGELREVHTPTFTGTIPGPTLRVKPGDRMLINMINNFPPNPETQRTGAFPHAPYTTNFHFHGGSVSPSGNADNVFRRMLPGTENLVDIEVPPDHQSGTFWYHPHKHGSVSFQFFGGMAGFIIVEGGEGTLDKVPEVEAAEEKLILFNIVRTDQQGNVPFVNNIATQQNSTPSDSLGVWSAYQNSFFYLTTNGKNNPVIKMKPGEVQRWRVLNAGSGVTLVVALEGHAFNLIANDGITVPEMVTFETEQPYVMASGNRGDFLIKAGEPGTYRLLALDPNGPADTEDGWSIITQSGIDPSPRSARIGFDFPIVSGETLLQEMTYPFTLATVIVEGEEMDMSLPEGPLPVPASIPSIETQLETTPDVERSVVWEICGTRFAMGGGPEDRLPSCGWYFDLYDADYWGGLKMTNLLMMRDADDNGEPNPVDDPFMPRINYQKEGLFDADVPLFDDMVAGNFEEWTIINRSFSDHPFHIHINPFLLTHINGKPLPQPEYRDTVLVPAATPQPSASSSLPITDPGITFGSVTFRTEFEPTLTGSAVMHCHIITHEDVGMMQRIDIIEP